MPAIAWLALQIAMASGFAVAAPPSGFDRDAPSMWICTGVGLRLVPLSVLDAGAPDTSPPADPAATCYWCQAFAGAASPNAPILAEARRLIAPGRILPHGTPEKVRAARMAAFQSRAPPMDIAA